MGCVLKMEEGRGEGRKYLTIEKCHKNPTVFLAMGVLSIEQQS